MSQLLTICVPLFLEPWLNIIVDGCLLQIAGRDDASPTVDRGCDRLLKTTPTKGRLIGRDGWLLEMAILSLVLVMILLDA
jgi:hypothetical protein